MTILHWKETPQLQIQIHHLLILNLPEVLIISAQGLFLTHTGNVLIYNGDCNLILILFKPLEPSGKFSLVTFCVSAEMGFKSQISDTPRVLLSVMSVSCLKTYNVGLLDSVADESNDQLSKCLQYNSLHTKQHQNFKGNSISYVLLYLILPGYSWGGGELVFQAGYHPRKRTFKTHPKHVFSRYENRP